MRKRNIQKLFFLSDEEAATLKAKAEAIGLSKSALLRALINGYQPRKKPDDSFYESMNELRAIGKNINRLTAKANALGYIDAPMLRAEVKRWRNFRAEIQDKFLVPEKESIKWR